MKHSDSGAIMAYLDGQLPVGDRAALDRHLGVCDLCRGELAMLKGFAREFTGAVNLLNGRIPLLAARAAVESSVPGHRSGASRFVTASVLKAAAIVILLAGAASAAIPGTPVRRLVENAVARLSGNVPAVVASPAPSVEAPGVLEFLQEVEGTGVVLDRSAGVSVSIHAPTEGARIAVRYADVDRGSVKALGANASIRFSPSGGSVDVYGVETGILVELPRSLRSASILVDGRPVFSKDGDGEPVLAPGASSFADGVIIQLNNR